MSLITTPTHHRQHRSSRRHFRHGQRAAALRAITGARLYLGGAVPTLAAAADSAGSCVAYVQAACILLKADNAALTTDVLAGRTSLLRAARSAKPVLDLITTWREAADPDRIAFARACGAEAIFDVLVAAV
jgi:hypothetical protein